MTEPTDLRLELSKEQADSLARLLDDEYHFPVNSNGHHKDCLRCQVATKLMQLGAKRLRVTR